MVQSLIKDPNAIYFLRPVDPIRDGCPTYYDEIKNPSDYQTVMKKVDAKKYRTMGELARDVELIFSKWVPSDQFMLTSVAGSSTRPARSRIWRARTRRCSGRNGRGR